MLIGEKHFSSHTYIMGILNVTPDSFSDGGRYNSTDKAVMRVEQMILEGTDLIDVGGESTRPGYVKISDDEEISRISPIIEKIKANFDIPVSVDTYKSRVAEAAIQSGADMINDIMGLRYDDAMAGIVKKYDKAVCIMHNRDTDKYSDFMSDVVSDLAESIDIADRHNILHERIIIDPGIGFAKSYAQNLEITDKLDALKVFGLPILYAASRKSMIGLALDLPSDQRIEGTLVTTVMAVQKGCLFVRVHDIKENKRAIIMTEKIMGKI